MATVTEANLEYEGSITIDEDLMDMAGIVHHEFVLVSNMNNGERFETYVIPGKRGSGVVCLNGATARKGMVGDRIFVFSLAYIPEGEAADYKPKIIILSKNNKPKQVL
jgi:aspartate 1-decarboxylase